MKNISVYISQLLGDQGIIKQEDIDTCRYGIDFFIASVLEISSVLVIALLVGNFIETLLYFTAFIPLRIYAGGYHADTQLRCYIILLGVYGLFTALINCIPVDAYVFIEIVSILFTAIMVWAFAPIVNDKKSINDSEKAFYRKFSITIMLIEFTTVIVSICFTQGNRYILSFSLGQLAVSTSMVAAFVKTKLQGR